MHRSSDQFYVYSFRTSFSHFFRTYQHCLKIDWSPQTPTPSCTHLCHRNGKNLRDEVIKWTFAAFNEALDKLVIIVIVRWLIQKVLNGIGLCYYHQDNFDSIMSMARTRVKDINQMSVIWDAKQVSLLIPFELKNWIPFQSAVWCYAPHN